MKSCYEQCAHFSQESASIASHAVQYLRDTVEKEIYINQLMSKMRPYLNQKIIYEQISLLNCCYLPRDNKLDDKYLEQSEEPCLPKQDQHQTHILEPLKYPQGIYTINYIENAKVQGELDKIYNQSNLLKPSDVQGSPGHKSSSRTLRNRGARESHNQSNVSKNKQQVDEFKDHIKKIEKDTEEVNIEEQKQIEYLRGLLEKKRFKQLQNGMANGPKNQKFLTHNSFMDTTRDSFFKQDDKKIMNKPYTTDHQGNVLLVKKLNAGNLAAARKDMGPNKNYVLPDISENAGGKPNRRQLSQAQKSASIQEKEKEQSQERVSSNHHSKQHSLLQLIRNFTQSTQQDQEPSEQVTVPIHPDTGVVIKDQEGRVLQQGNNYSQIQFSNAKKMNLSLYNTQFRNTFQLASDQKKDLLTVKPLNQKSNSGSNHQSRLSSTAKDYNNSQQFQQVPFKKSNYDFISKKMDKKTQEQLIDVSSIFTSQERQNYDSRNIKNSNNFNKDSLMASFDMQRSYSITRYNKPMTSGGGLTMNKRRQIQTTKGRVLIYDTANTIGGTNKTFNSTINGSFDQGSDKKSLNQKFNLNIIGKLNDQKEIEDLNKYSSIVKDRIGSQQTRNQQVKTSSQLHRERLNSQGINTSRGLQSRGARVLISRNPNDTSNNL